MRNIRSIITTMLAALLALPALARDFEFEGLTYTVLDEDALTCQTKEGGYSFADSQYFPGNDVSGELVIPGTVSDGSKSFSVVKIGPYTFARTALTSVVIPESVKTIGVNAFMDCHSLESVSIPESVTSIEPYAFQYTAIRELTLPSSMTEVEDCAFYHCGSLSTINLPESITKIGAYSFFECNSTNRSLTLPSKLEYIGDFAFAQSGITSVELPESLVSVGIGAFGDGFEQIIQASSSSLISVSIPASLKSIGEFAFNKSYYGLDVTYYAEKPEPMPESLFNDETYYRGNTLTMPNANLADIMAVSPWNRFARIIAKDGSIEPSAEEVNFQYNGMTYTVMDAEAKTCRTNDYWWPFNKDNLSSEMFADGLVIPSIVSDGTNDYTVVEIGFQTFAGCEYLTSITLPETLKTIRSQAFISCGNLTSIEIPSSVVNIDQEAFRESGLESIDIPEYITYIARGVFHGCKNLTTVNLPDRLTAIGVEAFSKCEKIASIQFPNSLIAISGSAFYTTPLSSLSLPESLKAIGAFNFNYCQDSSIELPEGLTSIGFRSFSGLNNLTSLTLPASLKYISSEAFYYNKLKDITYNASNPITALTDIFYVEGAEDYHFNAYKSTRLNMPNATLAMTESVIPWSLFESIKASDGSIGMGLAAGDDFEYEGIWYTVIDPEAKTVKTKEGDWNNGDTYGGNKYSGNLVIPAVASDGMNDYTVVEIGQYSFSKNTEIISVSIPEGIETIGEYAFIHCYGLTSVNIPASVTTIGDRAFGLCEELTSVTYNASSPITAPEGVFYSWTMQIYDKATLYMPNATLADIQATVPWNQFKKIVASDGSIGGNLAAGDDFEYEGLVYTVLDVQKRTVETKAGHHSEEAPNAAPEGMKRTGHFGVTGYTIPGNNCEGEIVIPSVVSDGQNEYTVVAIGEDGFHNCENLTGVTFPETLQTIKHTAFEDTGLLSLNLPNSLKVIEESAFISCDGLKELVFPESLEYIGQYAFYACNNLETVTLPTNNEFIIEDAALDSCYNIKTVIYNVSEPHDFPDSVFTDEVYETATLEMRNAMLMDILNIHPWSRFRHIIASDGTIGFGASDGEDFEYEGVWYTVISTDARTCKTKDGEYSVDGNGSPNNITGELIIPNLVSDGHGNEYRVVEIGEWSFFRNTGITSVQLTENIAALGRGAFYGCSGMTSIAIPSSVNVLPESIFDSCTSLTSVRLPGTLQVISGLAFAGCESLESINLPEYLTRIEGFQAFANCTSLKEIRFHDNLTYIGEQAFLQCYNLTSVNLPPRLEFIGKEAFYVCGLTSINIPESVMTIESGAFKGSNAITDVRYEAATLVSAEEDVFSDVVYANATLNTPNATLEAVQSTVPWSLFKRAVASDGEIGFKEPVNPGEPFEFDGIIYSVLDGEAMLCRIEESRNPEAVIEIPEQVPYNDNVFTVVSVANQAFAGSGNLVSISLPASIQDVGNDVFDGCERLSSIVWRGVDFMPVRLLESIDNPNLLVYVDDDRFAPESLDHNVIANGICENLVVTPGYPFHPYGGFTANRSSMTKEFMQQTAYDGCAGWESIVLPFSATRITSPEGKPLKPFGPSTDVKKVRPFWLYEADPAGDWMATDTIKAGMPYLIAMPNNPRYNPAYNVQGAVTFSSATPQVISSDVTAPYVVSWTSGAQFHSLWMPLTASEASTAMGLNVNMTDMRDDNGQLLAPGSAFCKGVEPKPLEAYVTDSTARAFPIKGLQTAVLMLEESDGLTVAQEGSMLMLKSAADRQVDIYSADGTLLRRVSLSAGQPVFVDGLPQGVCLVAGRKVMIR